MLHGQQMTPRRLPDIPIDPPKEYFASVGEVAIRWSRLEYQMSVLARVGFKLGKDEQRSLIIGMDMTTLTGVLRAVAQGWVKDRPFAQELTALADDIAKLRNRRGDFVHGLYGYWLGTTKPWQLFKLKSPKQRGNIASEEISPEAISRFAAELRALQFRAQDLTTRLKAIHGTRS
jgi:hypothetical protein